MNKAGHTALLAAAALAAAVDTAVAEPTARVEYSDAFTTRTPGAPSGRLFHDEFFDARDASAKPPPVQHFHVQLPHGARFNWRAVPLCTASDAELMAEGPSACPAGSNVGAEVFSFDTGAEGPNRIVTNDITFLNNKEELIILTQERQSGTRVVVRGKLGPETFDFDLLPLPGTPPDGGADKREDAKYPISLGPTRKAWLTTPPTCPASGKWTFRIDYTFRNGEKVTKTSDARCDRARIVFFHRQHGRTMRVRSSSATTAQLRIYRGATRIYTRRVQLKAGLNRLQLPSLPKGTYRLTLGGRGATLTIR
ncbi:MAG: hypothetical protein QOF65_856 [Thermoleophilaceae bacterium]|jgi:hypothetical protein|nr:hypothetical protein [Thermoleophilaceae bacterium]